MSFVENLLNRLFPEKQSAAEAFIKETLTRNNREQVDYFNWVKAKGYHALNEEFYLAYFLKKRRINSGTNIQIFHSHFANAVSISYNPKVTHKDFQYYFDFLKEHVLKLGYSLQYGEKEVTDRHHYLETVERYYLTFPENLKIGGRIHQLYGNMLIEQILLDEQPSYIKIVANYFPDNESYFPPLPFDELMDKLFLWKIKQVTVGSFLVGNFIFELLFFFEKLPTEN